MCSKLLYGIVGRRLCWYFQLTFPGWRSFSLHQNCPVKSNTLPSCIPVFGSLAKLLNKPQDLLTSAALGVRFKRLFGAKLTGPGPSGSGFPPSPCGTWLLRCAERFFCGRLFSPEIVHHFMRVGAGYFVCFCFCGALWNRAPGSCCSTLHVLSLAVYSENHVVFRAANISQMKEN